VLLVSDNGTRLAFFLSQRVRKLSGAFMRRAYAVTVVLLHLPSRPLCLRYESSQITHVALFLTSVGWEHYGLKVGMQRN
jgi:hypothetical protein